MCLAEWHILQMLANNLISTIAIAFYGKKVSRFLCVFLIKLSNFDLPKSGTGHFWNNMP
jgi:hypothetical protein